MAIIPEYHRTDTPPQNPNATLPTFVADGKAYTSTADVTRYLVQNAPKKVAPGTPAFIDRIHEDALDPNFILLSTVRTHTAYPSFNPQLTEELYQRNEDELKAAASGFPLVFVQNRMFQGLISHSPLSTHLWFDRTKRA